MKAFSIPCLLSREDLLKNHLQRSQNQGVLTKVSSTSDKQITSIVTVTPTTNSTENSASLSCTTNFLSSQDSNTVHGNFSPSSSGISSQSSCYSSQEQLNTTLTEQSSVPPLKLKKVQSDNGRVCYCVHPKSDTPTLIDTTPSISFPVLSSPSIASPILSSHSSPNASPFVSSFQCLSSPLFSIPCSSHIITDHSSPLPSLPLTLITIPPEEEQEVASSYSSPAETKTITDVIFKLNSCKRSNTSSGLKRQLNLRSDSESVKKQRITSSDNSLVKHIPCNRLNSASLLPWGDRRPQQIPLKTIPNIVFNPSLVHTNKLLQATPPYPLPLNLPTQIPSFSSNIIYSTAKTKHEYSSNYPCIKTHTTVSHTCARARGFSQNYKAHSKKVSSMNGLTASSVGNPQTPVLHHYPPQVQTQVQTTLSRVEEPIPDEKYILILLTWQENLNKKRGTEGAIFVENVIDRAVPPQNFHYITSSIPREGVPDAIPTALVGCDCRQCSDSTFCCPHMAGHKPAYTKTGKIRADKGSPIYECNLMCMCELDCVNRVVQRGRRFPVCIFRTPDRGWGVKTCVALKKGTFVTEYVGEILTAEEAERRGQEYDKIGSNYLFDLDFVEDQSMFTIDATYYGNISHFFNHSCDPNLQVYSVWINTLDPRLPHLALFATRDIAKDEELTFDYQMGHNMSASKKGKVRCLCGSAKCVGYLF